MMYEIDGSKDLHIKETITQKILDKEGLKQ